MTTIHRCYTFGGTYAQMLMPVFLSMLVFISFAVYMVVYQINDYAPAAMMGGVILLFMASLIIRVRKHSYKSLELTDNEFRFYDKSGQLAYTISLDDISSLVPQPVYNELPMKLAIRTKDHFTLTVFVSEEAYQMLAGKLAGRPFFHPGSANQVPLYMHFVFVFFLAALALFSYHVFVLGKPLKFQILWYSFVASLFVVYYISLNKKMKSRDK